MPKHTFMLINTEPKITEPHFVDALDDTPFVFELDCVDNPLDQDDPESALDAYYRHVFA